MPLVAGAVALTATSRPRVGVHGARALDGALVACLLAVAAQMAPMPRSFRDALSPAAATVERAVYFGGHTGPAPLSVDVPSTAYALALAAGVVLLFWCAREIVAGGSPGRMLQPVALCGLTASAIAILQHATAPGLLYWTWRPESRNASPFSPFVNKNDLAAWLVMALPLTVGYLVARADARRRRNVGAWAGPLDDKDAWPVAAACAMTAALIVALSRSGFAAFAAGVLAFAWLSRGRVVRAWRWGLAGLAVLALIVLVYGSSAAILTRLAETFDGGIGGRRDIWSLTWRLVTHFPAVGVGAGAYARAMSVYQPPHDFAFNHAHNEYLQVLSEGGVVLATLALTAIAAGAASAARRLRRDRTPYFWIRAGALSAVIAIAVQSVWETGLRMPANAVLFALCCAMALRESPSPDSPGALPPTRAGTKK